MCDRHAPVSDTDQCAHRGAIGSCSGWIVGNPEVIHKRASGDVVARELDIHLQALSYLMTTVIHRLHETDPAWWQELLKEIKAERKAIVRDAPGADIADQVLARAIGIVERALAPQHSPPEKPQKPVARKHEK
jgi:hypothetical protein